jgi:hypothetical protein
VWECGTYLASAATGVHPNNVANSAVVQQIRTQPMLQSLLCKCFAM